MITVTLTLAEEAPVLSAIQKEAFRPLYERYHDEGNPHLRGEEDITKRLGRTDFRCYTIREDGEIVGGIFYKCAGRTIFVDPLRHDDCYLGRIFIRPDRQGRGIAKVAIRMTMAEFPDARRFWVDYPADLEKNRRCYERCGFSDTGKRMEVEDGKLTLACLVCEKGGEV